MCYLITATLPPGADAGAIRPIAKRFGGAWRLLTVRHIARQLRSGETYYYAIRGWCDCNTGLGILKRRQPEDDANAKARHFKKRGWSAAKIARALASRQAALQHKPDRWRQLGEEDAARWLDFLHAAVGSGLTPSLGLLMHFYDGGLEEAEFKFGREAVSLSKIDVALLLNMEVDRLYEFFP